MILCREILPQQVSWQVSLGPTTFWFPLRACRPPVLSCSVLPVLSSCLATGQNLISKLNLGQIEDGTRMPRTRGK